MRLALAFIAIITGTAAVAEGCGTVADVSALLRDTYDERVISTGLDISGNVMTVWANTVTGTWTVTATSPAGITCLVGAGDTFEHVNEAQGVDG